MERLSAEEIERVAKFSVVLMSAAEDDSTGPKLMGLAAEPVPDHMAAHGIEGISYGEKSVLYYWCGGGPVERTLLEVRQTENGELKFIGHFRDRTELVHLHTTTANKTR